MCRTGSFKVAEFFKCIALAILIVCPVVAWRAHGMELGVDKSISLPIKFFGLKDDPRLAGMNDYAGPPGFDRDGVAYFRAGRWLVRQDASGVQKKIDLIEASAGAIERDLFHGGMRWDRNVDVSQMIDDRVVLDRNGSLYTILTPKGSNLNSAVLLYTLDRGAKWQAIRLKGLTGSLEAWDGFNDKEGPPVVSTIDRYGKAQGSRYWVQRFEVRGGALAPMFAPVLVSSSSGLVPNHSGGSNTTYTRGGKILVVYPSSETTSAGTVVYGREIDATNGDFLGEEIRLGLSGAVSRKEVLPADPHNIPAITQNRSGVTTVILGAHHGMLLSLSSIEVLTLHGQWTAPAPIGQTRKNGQFGSYTYVSAMTDLKDNLHVFSRSEGYRYRFQLVQIEKYANGRVRVWPDGLRHRVVADVDRSLYAAWRQRLSLDANGCIYLHFKYWPSQLSSAEEAVLGVSRERGYNCRDGNCFVRSLEPLFPTTIFSCDSGGNFKVLSHGGRVDS